MKETFEKKQSDFVEFTLKNENSKFLINKNHIIYVDVDSKIALIELDELVWVKESYEEIKVKLGIMSYEELEKRNELEKLGFKIV